MAKTRLQEKYLSEVVKALHDKFQYKNVMEIPKVEKVVINMVLGIYYMTAIKPNAKGTGKRFSSPDEVRMAAELGNIEWQALIKVPAPKDSFNSKALKVKGDEGFISGTQDFKEGELIETSAGRLAFNEAMPEGIEYVNRQMFDKSLKKMIEYVFHNKGSWMTIQMHDAIKDVGYKNATFYGATLFGFEDIPDIPSDSNGDSTQGE